MPILLVVTGVPDDEADEIGNPLELRHPVL